MSILASACAVCTQCPRSAHAVQTLSHRGEGSSLYTQFSSCREDPQPRCGVGLSSARKLFLVPPRQHLVQVRCMCLLRPTLIVGTQTQTHTRAQTGGANSVDWSVRFCCFCALGICMGTHAGAEAHLRGIKYTPILHFLCAWYAHWRDDGKGCYVPVRSKAGVLIVGGRRRMAGA